ncbi:MAG: hypothetical protein JWP08_1606 [Bryobacterales bacterium]|nr:hypothetical protein [Bryobacterales bacterium]
MTSSPAQSDPLVSVSSDAATSSKERTRVHSMDVLRGLVMVLMALDHTREFFTNFSGNPLDPQHTTLLLFLTRWVTHICAPVFVFLAGTSIFLQQQSKTRGQLTRFLLTRGLWLILAELTLIHLVFSFHSPWDVQLLEVIWAIGASMMAMALFIHFGVRANLLLGALLAAGHNALDKMAPASFGTLGWAWKLLHVPGLVNATGMKAPLVIVAYPLLPWVGVMALGYAFGSVLLRRREQRIRFEMRAGAAMLGAFVLLRWCNTYGDPLPWSVQANWWRTVLSFINVQKYPPSLLFLLAMLGLAALLFSAIERAEQGVMIQPARAVLEVYGRVPFAYFVLHIALIHLLTLLIAATSGGDWRWWLKEFPSGGVLSGHPPGYGYGLSFIWCMWIFVVVCCYPACNFYGQLKRRSRNRLLSYL